jgi:hypothetical protein
LPSNPWRRLAASPSPVIIKQLKTLNILNDLG